MKTKLLVAMLLLCLPLSAYGFDWSIGARVGGGQTYIQSSEFEFIYDRNHLEAVQFVVWADLFHGLGPYMAMLGENAKNRYRDEIWFEMSVVDVAIGPQYRLNLSPWLKPEIRVAFLSVGANQDLYDDHFRYEDQADGFGFEVAHGWQILPLGHFDHKAPRNLGLQVEVVYLSRPVADELGKIDDLSGWGWRVHIGYAWDFGEDRPPIFGVSEKSDKP